MIEPTPDPLRSPAAVGSPRQINGAPLRWTPGPDELRLPFEAETVPQGPRHLYILAESVDSLRLHWRGRQDVFVGGDQFVYWSKEKPATSPDVYVAFGVAARPRNSYVVWEEGKPPDFVLELVSPSSRERDEKEKPCIYAQMGVPEYFWYDPEGKLAPALAGFELCGCEYRPLPEETLLGGVAGVRSKALGLCLCIKPSGPERDDVALRWYDPAAGEFLPVRHEFAEDKRRSAERERRLAENERRLADDKQRLAEDNRRLAEAKQQAEATAEVAVAKAAVSAARVAELEALIEKMRG